MTLLSNLAILVLAAFVGFSVISKVPNTLHTPLMSGTNAIHGIVLLAGLVLLGRSASGAFERHQCGGRVPRDRPDARHFQKEAEPRTGKGCSSP